ncbi:MAG: phospholipid/cholesterol/gamma-HCH transport system substrate-binding protein [Pseudonocardiales bacterium]|jgi:phospholipid/cholesterol/gamma-HCH transport system substrate-binding protein|nr:phospholipid/cholesterol/gamma-HCH transport system substrate-binding protein [Pseudonocardiales bacterium]
MIRRTTKFQLLAFLVISLLGVSYVGFNYVGLGSTLFGPGGCVVSANFPDSGGIFTNAEVTYRGVTVGKVGDLHLLDYTDSDGVKVRGVRVDLRLSDCTSRRIPIDSQAYVSDRSAVGEQYVNLDPPSSAGPFLTSGAVLTKPGKVPVATQVLLQNLDDLVSHVDTAKLNTLITELGTAFNGRGPDLQALLDAGDQLLARAEQALPETLKLIDNSQTVLKTQLDSGSAIKGWAHSLNLLSAQLRSSDRDINALLSAGPGELDTVRGLITGNRDDLSVLLANLTSVNQVLVSKLDGIETILLIYPSAIAGGFTVTPGDGTAHFGLVVNNDDPPTCIAGYQGTAKRQPSQTGPTSVNTGARCTLPRGSASSVRGAQNAPGGDPISSSGGGTAYPRTVPGSASAGPSVSSILLGGSAAGSQVLADDSWLPLLTGGLS